MLLKIEKVIILRLQNFEIFRIKLFPFFYKYPVLGVKSKDFDDFCKVVKLMENKVHFDKIRIRANSSNSSWNEYRKEILLVEKKLSFFLVYIFVGLILIALVGIGVVFGALILGVARNPAQKSQLFSYAILGFAFSEATGLSE